MSTARIEIHGQTIVLDDEALLPYRDRLEQRDAKRGQCPQPVRQVHAAAHLVMTENYAWLPHTESRPGSPSEIAGCIDWVATQKLRERLAALGFGIAEAMDTAQRFEIGWDSAKRLVKDCAPSDPPFPTIVGAGTDQERYLETRSQIVEAWLEQVRWIQESHCVPILLPQPALVQLGYDEDDYVSIYGELIERSSGMLYIHWLGEAFHPGLRGYFPGNSFRRILELDPSKLRGAKLSLLDQDFEEALRAEIAERGQRILTGDDFHFADLILGKDGQDSDALLGIFDAIALPASLALRFLAHGDHEQYLDIMRPCEALSRRIFEAPTHRYKAGLAFLSYLNGHQDNPLLPNRVEKGRDRGHYEELLRLASAASCIENAALAAERAALFMETLED